jgi:hypothetical protein
MHPLCIPRQVEPLRQLDLRDQQEDRRGDLIAAPVFAREATRLAAAVDAGPVGNEQARAAATVDEAQSQAAAALPFAGRDLAAAEATAGGLGRDREPEPVP